MQYSAWIILLLLSVACQSPKTISSVQPDPNSELIEITLTEGTNFAAALSPDGRKLVIDLQGRLWILPSSGGKATAITDPYGDARQPHWSPDGKRICFQGYWEGNWHIYTIHPDGSGIRQITTGKYDHREPHWSPDGLSIAYSSDQNGSYDIWQYSVKDDINVALTESDFEEYGPAYAPDGKKILYTRKEGVETFIEEVEIESEKIRGIYSIEAEIYGLSYQPDGQGIVFNVLKDLKSELYTYDLFADRTVPVLVSESKEDVFPFRSTWMDNDQFIYTASGKILNRNLSSSIVTKIPFEAKILIERKQYLKKKRDFDQQGNHKVKGIYQPDISREGHIGFAALGDIWIQSQTGQLTRVTNDRYIQVAPKWSRSGSLLAYASDIDNDLSIWTYSFESGEHTKIASIPTMPNGMDWGEEDSAIYFSMNFGPRTGMLWKCDKESGKTTPLGRPYPYSVSAPSYSSQHGKLAMTLLSPYSGLYREGVNRIILADEDGYATWNLKNLPHLSAGMRGNDGPVWSPDGTRLAYTSNGHIWVASVGANRMINSEPEQLTEELSDSPGWTDSDHVHYQTPEDLKIINIHDRTVRKIEIGLHWSPEKRNEALVIKNVKVLRPDFQGFTESVDLVIEDNRIISIDQYQSTSVSARIIDAQGKYVIPGLIDIHAHQGSFGGEIMGRQWLSWGVTSTRDPATNPYDALNRREGRASGSLLHPRIFFTGSPIDGNRVYYDGTYAIDQKEQVLLELERARQLDYDMVKTYVRLRDPWQKEVVAKAHSIGLPVSSHELYPAAAYGVDGIEHILGTSRRGYSPKMTRTYHAYGDATDIIARSGMTFTPTISIYVGYDYMIAKHPSIINDRRIQKLESERIKAALKASIQKVKNAPELHRKQFQNAAQMIKDVHDKNGKIVAGTDSPILPYGFGLFIELLCFEEAGLEPFEVLQTATINNARALSVQEDLGTIEIGKLADLLILSENPLEDLMALKDIEYVVLDGKVITMEALIDNTTE